MEVAIKHIHPTKAPSSDVVEALFYQKYWSIVGEETNCFNFLNGEMDVDAFNNTFIVLSPNIKVSVHIKDFRPISLCNAIYKNIAKAPGINKFLIVLSLLLNQLLSRERQCNFGFLMYLFFKQ